MSDELLKNDESQDEDVEAHKHVRMGTDDLEDAEDVEAHKHVRMGTDDESDDVEAHRRQA
jgi:hypothetical protein